MIINKFSKCLASILLLTACQLAGDKGIKPANSKDTGTVTLNLIQYVNPFIGTKNMGHTFPGTSTPFGMVQLSPETNIQSMFDRDGRYNKNTHRYCSEY